MRQRGQRVALSNSLYIFILDGIMPEAGEPARIRGQEMDKKRFDGLLQMAVEDGVSDIIFAVGEPPVFRYSGALMDVKSDPVEPRDIELLARILLQHRVEDFNSFNAAEVA